MIYQYVFAHGVRTSHSDFNVPVLVGLIGAFAVGIFGFIYFGLLDIAAPALVFIAIVLSLIPHDMQYGPQAALIAEAFTPPKRYSGASLGYQLASIIAGGQAPIIATSPSARHHTGYSIAAYIAICAVISIIATARPTSPAKTSRLNSTKPHEAGVW